MGHTIQLELPDHLMDQVSKLAEHKHQTPEEVLVDWINRTVNESPIDDLPDEEVLFLVDMHLGEELQEELSDLLFHNQERSLSEKERVRLDELLEIEKRGTLRKAQALSVAVQRGLRPRLDA